jgi:TIR domain/Pentapeptide repeats (8 copies)
MADLSKANLRNAILSSALLRQTLLAGTNFEGAAVGDTIFGAVDLSSCIGLDAIVHRYRSTLGVDSIIRSKGRLPEAFLRGVGLPDEWIAYIPSLTSEFEFFSTFISYSSMDKSFAHRLYETLQSKGIRCWLDEKQLIPGDDISRRLGHGIHKWDKFLLCASKNSLTSPWVEEEIQTALEKERMLRQERGKKVYKLIPLNLDGYMFSKEWDLGTHAGEIKARVAGNFRGWDTPGFNFDEQVARVIKALRADEGAREPDPPSKL